MNEPKLVCFENNYIEYGEDLRDNPDALAAVFIDGYPRDENAEGEVVAVVWLTKHGDIITDFHDNAYRLVPEVEKLVENSKEILREYSLTTDKLLNPAAQQEPERNKGD